MRHVPPAAGRSGSMERTAVPSSAFFVKVPVFADAVTTDIAAIRLGLGHATRVAAEAGWTVHFVNGMYLPAETCLLCAFTAGGEEAVHAAVRLIERPYAVVEIRAGATGPLPHRTPAPRP